MPYILWIHVVVAVYMYGNGSIFPVEISSDQTMEEAMRESREALNFADKLNVKVPAASKASAIRSWRFQSYRASGLVRRSCAATLAAFCKGQVQPYPGIQW